MSERGSLPGVGRVILWSIVFGGTLLTAGLALLQPSEIIARLALTFAWPVGAAIVVADASAQLPSPRLFLRVPRLRDVLLTVPLAMALFALHAFVSPPWLKLFGALPSSEPSDGPPVVTGLSIALLCLIGPVCEELVFRGAMLDALSHRWPPALAALATAIPFAMLHAIFGWSGDVVLGVVLALWVMRTGSIWLAVAIHAAWNASSLLGPVQAFESSLPAMSWSRIAMFGALGIAGIGLVERLSRRKER